MALKTLGTNAQTTLSAAQWNSAMSVADLASLNALFKFTTSTLSLQPAPTTFAPNAMISQGKICHPIRGIWKLMEGDWIGADPNTGDIIVLSAPTAAAASWVHT